MLGSFEIEWSWMWIVTGYCIQLWNQRSNLWFEWNPLSIEGFYYLERPNVLMRVEERWKWNKERLSCLGIGSSKEQVILREQGPVSKVDNVG